TCEQLPKWNARSCAGAAKEYWRRKRKFEPSWKSARRPRRKAAENPQPVNPGIPKVEIVYESPQALRGRARDGRAADTPEIVELMEAKLAAAFRADGLHPATLEPSWSAQAAASTPRRADEWTSGRVTSAVLGGAEAAPTAIGCATFLCSS